MRQGSLTARQLRVLLLTALVVIFIATVAGFLYVQGNLRTYATTISKLNADAASGDENIKTLRQLQDRLNQEKETVQAAHNLIADNANYSDSVLSQLTTISRQSGVTITSIDFGADTATGTAAPSAAAAGGSAPATGVVSPQVATGIQTKSVTVTIDSPLPYNNLMNFLKRIESGSLQMQVEGVALTKDKDNKVSTPALTIKAFVRS